MSIVSTVSIPRPENLRGRSTWRHWTIGRAAVGAPPGRASLYDGSQLERRDEATTPRFCARSAASASAADPSGRSKGNPSGTGDDTTRRTLDPTRRAVRYEPSRLIVRTIRRAEGSETSISVSLEPGRATPFCAATDAVAPGSGVIHAPPREIT